MLASAAIAALVLLGEVTPSSARPRTLTVEVSGQDCPSAAAVESELRKVVPPEIHLGAGGEAVDIHAMPEAVSLSFEGHFKSFAASECGARAKSIAAHVALALLRRQSQGSGNPRPEADAQPPARRPLLASTVTVRSSPAPREAVAPLYGSFMVGTGFAARKGALPAPSVFVRAAMMRGRWGVAFGFGVEGQLRHPFPNAEARVTRMPIELALRWTLLPNPWFAGLDAGPRATLMRIRGGLLSHPETSVRLEPSLAAGPFLGRRVGRNWGLAAQLSTAYAPRRLAVRAEPWGTLGSLPRWGFSGGLAFFWSAQ